MGVIKKPKPSMSTCFTFAMNKTGFAVATV